MIDKDRLHTLSELEDWELVNKDQDIRGHALMMRSGRKLGIIRRMLVDRDHERVAALVLDDGRTIPVEDVEIRGGEAYIEDIDEKTLATAPMAPPPRTQAGTREERIPVVEEELAVGKRMVERGHVRVRSRVVEKPVSEQVRLREERVDVERRPVNAPVADADRLLRDRDVEFTERGEEAVIGKRARVTEEVIVHKDVGERTENVQDTVRHTQVDVDREPDRLAAKGGPAAGKDRDKLR